MRRWTAGCAVIAAIAATGACTATEPAAGARTAPPQPANAAAAQRGCEDGRYTWFNIERPLRLTGLAAPEKKGKDGGALRHPVRRLSTPVTFVTAVGPELSSRDVLFSLALRIGEAAPGDAAGTLTFTEAGRGPDDFDAVATTPSGAGRFVRWADVQAVEADFRHTCPGGRTTTGHAESWTVEGQGLLDCDQHVDSDSGRPGSHALARKAARLSCGPDAAAARS
ncbi:hypothetical protein ACFYXS_26035 [Streptomyces sp. NPDC002574]|uniref:hypothetical protein n=1 Tax=Streptomyces sp. NPDC002574 TaxID=3364652 RepID=UPI00368C70A8